MATPSHERLEGWILESAPLALAYTASLLATTSRPDQGEQIVQDAYCQVHSQCKDQDGKSSGDKLLYAAITRACMKLDRLSPEESRSSPTGQPRLKEIESKNKPTIQEAVASALQSLPMRTRSALELRSIGFTPLEVAWILNMSGKNANVLIHEGREVLSRHLAGLAGEALE